MKPDFVAKAVTALKSPRFQPGLTTMAIGAFAGAAAVSALIAWGAATVIEARSARMVGEALVQEGFTWSAVKTDGLQVQLTGTAPNEAARFRAVSLAARIVDASRVVDQMDVTPARAFDAPDFSIEMLRNDDGIQLIGLLPTGDGEQTLIDAARALAPDVTPAEMLETASYPVPETWAPAFDFGLKALKLLPRSKISVDATRVNITAIAASAGEKRQFESQLAQMRPDGINVTVDISAPRPVLTPFTLRFVKDGEGARFDACSADTPAAQRRILTAARTAGLAETVNCTIGLGVPTPSWGMAAEAGIHAVEKMGAGTITFSDADVSLLASEDVSQATFDRVVGELQAALPAVFSLNAILPKKEIATPEGPSEFTAQLNGETGRIELRGRLTDQMQRDAVSSFARARFGAAKVYSATRLDPELPVGWPVRVLAALESLAELNSGSILVRNDLVEVSGVTGNQAARDRISQILSGKLGQGQTFRVNVTYDEALDPLAALPTPQECHDDIATLLAQDKIAFAPGSAEIDGKSTGVMTKLSDTLRKCSGVRMEIGGYTDSQGSDQGNLALSQARAEAVLIALQGRRVDVSWLRAVGYGEANPIADNATEEGREANRRIEFALLDVPKPAQADGDDGAPDATDGDQAMDGDDATAGTTGPIDANTCRQGIIAVLAREQITFDPGSANISADAQDVIAQIADQLKSCPGTPMEVSGHTDSQGSLRGNQQLSQERANAVLLALAKQEVDISVLKAVGYGETNPIATNDTEAGRETNRRIEFFVINQAGQTQTDADGETGGDAAPDATDAAQDAITSDADTDTADGDPPPAAEATADDTADGTTAAPADAASQSAQTASDGDASATPATDSDAPATDTADATSGAADAPPAPQATTAQPDAADPAPTTPPAATAPAVEPAPGATAQPATDANPATDAGPAADAGPDFSGDDSPSLAPQEKTQTPPARPARNG